jgi:peptidoglycan/LPS O-acetylase OafA/YrhL
MKRAGIKYQPALDGLRAFAVTAVILYHFAYSWAKGGYLGVDTFFVLSGFLITTLLIGERAVAGRVSLSGFWARRARRLLPALFLLLVVVVLYAGTTMTALQLDDLRGDALASLFYVANWHFIATNQSYFSLFIQPSPLQHLWSLAIEEQFYLLWPLIVVGVLLLARGSRRALAAVTVVGIVVSQILMALLYSESNPSRAYYGTEARAHTLLVGCLLALLLSGRLEVGVSGRLRRVLPAAGVIAFAICIVMFSTTTVGPRLFYGGDLAFAMLVAVIIAAAVQPAGPLRAFLGLRAFRYVGEISYGLYLWHWPVIVFVTGADTGLGATALNTLRLAITFACTLVSFYLLEQPIRHGKLSPRLSRIALPVSIAVVAVVIIAGTASSEKTPDPIARINHRPGPCGAALPSERTQARAELRQLKPLPVAAQAPGLRVLVIGDSIACSLLTGLEATAATQGAQVDNAAILGCGVVADTVWKESFLPRPFAKHCPGLARTRQQRAIDRAAPNAIVWWSEWETSDLEVDGKQVKFGSDRFDEVLNQRMENVFERLHRPGVPIVILTSPPLLPSPAFPIHFASADAKHRHLNNLYRKFAARHPGDVVVVDLARHICPGPAPCPAEVDGFQPRPYDGLHLSPTGAAWAAHWLWPQIVDATRADATTPG